MAKNIFKGIKQVTIETFNSTINKLGYIWFVREPVSIPEGNASPFDENKYHIYFGDTKYGEFWNGTYEAISALAEAISNQNIAITNKQDVINDLEAIRNGASKGMTALQEVPSEYAKISVVEEMIANAITTALNTEL